MHWLWRFPGGFSDAITFRGILVSAIGATAFVPMLFWIALQSLQSVNPATDHLNYSMVKDALEIGLISPMLSWSGFLFLIPGFVCLRNIGFSGLMPTLLLGSIAGTVGPSVVLSFYLMLSDQYSSSNLMNLIKPAMYLAPYGAAHAFVFWIFLIAYSTILQPEEPT
ncbi:MAG: hypothetical protein ACI861_000458 [Paracoccaceae bacterium]|jgi:hypothetical protein